MKLYFVALIPPKETEERIRSLKQEMRTHYGSSRALKLPAHITLQIPFKMEEEQEPKLIRVLESFSEEIPPFPVEISGFGSFPPRVLFVKVKNPPHIIEVFKKLQKKMYPELELKENEKMHSIHPHMTIAFRDLTKDAYTEAWKGFKNREFEAVFWAKDLVLLKHNGKTWDIFRKFNFLPSKEGQASNFP